MSDPVDAKAEQRTASQMLSEARIAMGLSQEEVAQELFLIPSYIRHIDSDDIDKIDKQAFVRGYLRSYAKLVNLDGDDMVNRFEKTQGAAPQKIEIRAVTQEPVGSTNFTGPVIQTAVMGLVGFIFVVSLVWFLVSSGEEESTPAVTARSVPEQVEPASEPNIEIVTQTTVEAVDEIVNEMSPPIELADNIITNIQTATEAEPELPITDEPAEELNQAADNVAEIVSESTEEVAETVAEELEEIEDAQELRGKEISIDRVDGVIRVDAGGSDELTFTFSDECWIEIEDAEGHAIYGDLNRAGDELVVSGVGPFEVLFGKAPAVTMLFNGEPFDLEPHTTSVDTAKVKVGN